MAHSINWFVENRVLYARVWDHQTIELVRESQIELKHYLDTGEELPFIHMIMDVRDMLSMPSSLSQLGSSMEVNRHPSLGWVVTIGTVSPVTRFLGTMLAKLFRLRFKRVQSISEAIEFLKEVDPTIDWNETHHEVLPVSVYEPGMQQE